jgi:ABC-type lipoprotein export system ATPase subunit
MNDPLMATCGAPGSGKTFLMQIIVNLDEVDLDNLCTNEEMRTVLKNETVAIFVTYNNSSTPIAIDNEHPECGLALRMLWQ